MLDNYKNGQVMFYEIISNAIKNNKVSHAYLFEINNNDNYMDIVKAFIKSLVCPYNYFNNEKCDNCFLCKRIDDNNYPEVKIIEPDGLWIKKDQLLSLQNEFNKKNIEGNKRIYVIKECEKLNKQASNSILKFLEEPTDNVVAILVTNNINMILETIISRCQIIKLVKESNIKLNNEIKEDVIDFIKVLEEKKCDTIILEKELWLNKFKERSIIIDAIDIMICFYNDMLLYNLGGSLVYFNDYEEVYKNLNINIDNIIRKMEILITNKDLVKYNLNVNLLLDKIIIEFGG